MTTPTDHDNEHRNPYDSSSNLDERVDDALRDMWKGDGDALDRLVENDSRSGPGAGQIIGKVIKDSASPDVATTLPHHIGPYTVIRVLGEGGMGIVYEARQEHPRRTVALKVIRGALISGQDSDQSFKMFQREVKTLARMEHPAIAGIFDAGCSREGQHYFAMELVSGLPLAQYVRKENLSVGHRIALLKKVCEAIHYAHQHGVIHRDLKPSNILVDHGGPKILDFGLAKITDADITVTTMQTETGKIQGTLAYMSPEQARGAVREISALSDVYALGVILFELLTGRLPYDIRGALLPEALRMICEDPPSRMGIHDRTLRGELETIVFKALEKDPARRYQSAATLAKDLGRYLQNEPILARPPTTMYQLRKLIGRHRLPFALAAVMFLLTTTVAVWMTILYRDADQLRRLSEAAHMAELTHRQAAEASLERAEEAEQQARIAAKKTERINAFLLDMLSGADPERAVGREVTVRELLTKATHSMDQAFVDQPEVDAAVRSVIGTTYRNLGHYEQAENQLRAALAIVRNLSDSAPGKHQPQLAQTLLDLARTLVLQNRFEEAESLYIEAETRLRATLGNRHPDTIRSISQRATLWWRQGRYQEAESVLQSAHASLSELLGENHVETIAVANDLALILNDQGKYAEAEPLFRSLLELTQQKFGQLHPQIGRAYNNLAWNLQRAGKYSEAESLYQKALEQWASSLGAEHPETTLGRNNLGMVLILQGKFADAEQVFRSALRINLEVLGEKHTQTGISCMGLAWALHERGQHEEADPLAENALRVFHETIGESHGLTASAYEIQGRGLILRQRFAEAEEPIQNAMRIRERVLGTSHSDTIRLYNEMAFALSKQDKLDAAELLFRKALEAYVRTVGERHHGTLASMHNLASVLEKQGKTPDALKMYRRAVELAEEVLPPGHWNTAVFHGSLGVCLTSLGEYEEAETHLLKTIEGLNAALGEENSRTEHFRKKLENLYEIWPKP